MKVRGRKLYAIIVHQADTVHKTDYQLVSLLIDLHGRYVIWGLLPVDNFPLVNIPNSYHLVETTGSHIVLRSGCHEEGRAQDVRVMQDLNRLVEVYIPNCDHAICTHREQIWRGSILGRPVDFEYITVVKIIPLFEGLRTQEWYLAALFNV